MRVLVEPSLAMHRVREVDIGFAVRRVVQHYAATGVALFPFSRKGSHPLAKYVFNMQHGIRNIQPKIHWYRDNAFVTRAFHGVVHRGKEK